MARARTRLARFDAADDEEGVEQRLRAGLQVAAARVGECHCVDHPHQLEAARFGLLPVAFCAPLVAARRAEDVQLGFVVHPARVLRRVNLAQPSFDT
ncbi:MAG: hypothetical protein ACT4QG_19960 [Sporichthyaceae bacterium]